MNDLFNNLLAPWHIDLDSTLLIGLLSWVYFLREIGLVVNGNCGCQPRPPMPKPPLNIYVPHQVD